MKLTQNRVGFIQPCANLLDPPSVTCEYHPEFLEFFDPLQCIAAHLQHTLP